MDLYEVADTGCMDAMKNVPTCPCVITVARKHKASCSHQRLGSQLKITPAGCCDFSLCFKAETGTALFLPSVSIQLATTLPYLSNPQKACLRHKPRLVWDRSRWHRARTRTLGNSLLETLRDGSSAESNSRAFARSGPSRASRSAGHGEVRRGARAPSRAPRASATRDTSRHSRLHAEKERLCLGPFQERFLFFL